MPLFDFLAGVYCRFTSAKSFIFWWPVLNYLEVEKDRYQQLFYLPIIKNNQPVFPCF
jgi:hypothetical protein